MRRALVTCALATLLAGCAGGLRGPRAPGPSGFPAAEEREPREGRVYQRGKATWYGGKHHGGPTASGERFDQHAMTAAHKSLPIDTVVRVVNERNGRAVLVRINDRGPYGKGRIVDVSFEAAKRLDMIRAGVVPCRLEIVKLGHGRYQRNRKPPPNPR